MEVVGMVDDEERGKLDEDGRRKVYAVDWLLLLSCAFFSLSFGRVPVLPRIRFVLCCTVADGKW
jgi:hypothetical protein